MAIYLRALLNGGQGTNGPIVSAEGFRLLSTPYIKAPEFSSTASYGYGIAVDVLDGHKILRHTGGMSCFASSIHVDRSGWRRSRCHLLRSMRCKATGRRPSRSMQIRLLRAEREAKPLPAAEALNDAAEVDQCPRIYGRVSRPRRQGAAFQGKWQQAPAHTSEGQGDRSAARPGKILFISTVQGSYSDYSLTFGRDQTNSKAGKRGDAAAEATPAPPSVVVEVAYGPDWYTNTAYRGEREFQTPPAYGALYPGRYRSDSGDDVRVFVRKGRLWIGDSPLAEIGSSLFRVGEDSWFPDTVEFLTIVEGRARLLRVIDEDCWRIEIGSD